MQPESRLGSSQRDIEELILNAMKKGDTARNLTSALSKDSSDKILFPEIQQAGLDEKALRNSLFGKIFFPVLEKIFPILAESNWYDIYDPAIPPEENLQLPYFDGYDFVNSSWTIYIRNRYGVWNWLDRLGFVPQPVQRVFFRADGTTCWSDGYYGDWYLNPAINYFQFEKHFGRGFGFSMAPRGMRIFQVIVTLSNLSLS